MAMLAHGLGMSYAGLEKISNIFGIPIMHLKTFQKHDKVVLAAEVETWEESPRRARQTTMEAYADMDPDVREKREQNPQSVIVIQVTFDGTWQKRGFTSLYSGVIDILTGQALDYVVLSKYCHTCAVNKAKLSEADFLKWREEELLH